VLSLPSEHVGGILRVRHHGEAFEFDSSKGPSVNTYYKHVDLPYGAFFTDCTHSVQEVTSGWRVVVQYDVYEEPVNEEINSDVEKSGSEEGIDRDEENDIDEEIHIENGYKDTIDRVFESLMCGKLIETSMIHDKEQTELVQAV
jgi:hypothetical protein